MTETTSSGAPETSAPTQSKLLRQLGLFDATMLVMGGIVGSGLFINPYVVAQRVHSPVLILGAWLLGGAVAMAGAFIYAELADRMPNVGGQYAYLRDSFHPLFGFLYGWVLLLVIMAGGMAAVTVTFTRYFLALTGLHWPEQWVVVGNDEAGAGSHLYFLQDGWTKSATAPEGLPRGFSWFNCPLTGGLMQGRNIASR